MIKQRIQQVAQLPKRAARLLSKRAHYVAEGARAVADSLRDEAGLADLVIIDDFFPNLLTSFRVAEFNFYMELFEHSRVYSTGLKPEGGFGRSVTLDEYERTYPYLAGRVRGYHPLRRINAKVMYGVMLNNADRIIRIAERALAPFAFTLYPGGGFLLEDESSDAKLRRITQSPMFRKVIATQDITKSYLLKTGVCSPEQIELVFGVVVPSERLAEGCDNHSRFGLNKDQLDVCFVAHKYLPGGLDKGYDRFIKCARLLLRSSLPVHFHIVGPWHPEDCDVSDLADKIHFYGPRLTSFFPGFYSKMDAIVSPNMPFILHPGAFDGFPTGCCVEAALCGTAVFCTDELSQNSGRFKEHQDIVIIPPDPHAISDILVTYGREPERLAVLGETGQIAFQLEYNLAAQMGPRSRILNQIMT